MRRGGYLSLGIKDVFDPKGRIDRITYFIYAMMLGIIFYVTLYGGEIGFTLLQAAYPAIVNPDWSSIPMIALALGLLAAILLPFLYGTFCIGAKRLHDLGLPAILSLVGLLPSLNYLLIEADVPGAATADSVLFWVALAFSLFLLFAPGKKGPNRYGENSTGAPLPKPKMLDS
jgi:uncharacterized membrane protein YhaH (DUF805 family)